MPEETKIFIRVLVADDSPFFRKVITDTLNSDREIIVLPPASNGKEAVNAALCFKPDVITMDMDMPVMDGILAVKEIMMFSPTRIVIITSPNSMNRKGYVPFDALESGALEIFDKKDFSKPEHARELIEKIKFLSKIKVISRTSYPNKSKLLSSQSITTNSRYLSRRSAQRIVAIASSTGGPEVLMKLLQTLNPDFPCPVLIVQHILGDFTKDLVAWLSSKCRIKIKIAENHDHLTDGTVYIAPPDCHMTVTDRGGIKLIQDPPVNGSRPSGDVLMESVAKAYGNGAIGIILTGMGADGAKGMKSIKDAHGITIAQDEKSCAIFGMPKTAINLGCVDKIVPVENLKSAIDEALMM